jgi:hypothetical protein
MTDSSSDPSSGPDKDDGHKDIQNWKIKFQELLVVCQEEIKKTTLIGKKMLNATTANSKLNELYEEIGRLAVKQMSSNLLEWNNSAANELVEKVKKLEDELNEFEKDVQDIKNS